MISHKTSTFECIYFRLINMANADDQKYAHITLEMPLEENKEFFKNLKWYFIRIHVLLMLATFLNVIKNIDAGEWNDALEWLKKEVPELKTNVDFRNGLVSARVRFIRSVSKLKFHFLNFFLLDNNIITIRNPFKVIRTHWKWNHSVWQMKNPNTKLHWPVWRRTSYIVTPSERVWLIFQSVGFKKAVNNWIYNSILSYRTIDIRRSRNPWQRNIHDTSSWNG